MKLRPLAAAAIAGAAGLAGAGAVAFACTPLAKLDLAQPSARPGEAVSVSGSSFVPSAATSANPVLLRFGSPNAAVVASATPDAAGRISASFTVPDVAAGYYVIVATQAGGTDPLGAPRAALQVLAEREAGSGAQPVAATTQRPAPGVPTALAATAGLLALATAGAGAALLARRERRPVPAPAKSRATRREP